MEHSKNCLSGVRNSCKKTDRLPCYCKCSRCADHRLTTIQQTTTPDSPITLHHDCYSDQSQSFTFSETQAGAEFDITEEITNLRQDHRDLYFVIHISYFFLLCSTFLAMKFIYGFGMQLQRRHPKLF